MKMHDRRPDERPREKLALYGAERLSDLELLMAIIGSGNKQADVSVIARRVLKVLQAKGADVLYDDLRQVGGLGAAKIPVILASFELARRHLLEPDRPVIDSPDKAAEQLADIRSRQQEYFVCLTLDGANRLINKHVISIGTLTASLVHPREVFAPAIADRAASIIVAHNHPSGSLRPSEADVAVTRRLRKAAELLDITLNDHIIITKSGYVSVL
ncbi:MAG: DNA repair protein RadC [Candidatus Saccharibacteria bacterium]|nr:DNA repair protein RadC [Candidatus Saccharibacteria bacterium]